MTDDLSDAWDADLLPDDATVWDPDLAGDVGSLVDLVNRLLDKGVVIAGEVTISVAGVDLVFLGLNALLTSVATAQEQLGRRVEPPPQPLSVLYAYCIRRKGDARPPGDLRGVESLPVELMEGATLGLWVSQGQVGAPTPDRLREHERVVRYALRSHTPLPMRFGTRFRGAAEALATLQAREAEFLACLATVEGRVEMGIRVFTPGVSPIPEEGGAGQPPTGRAYLESRRRSLLRAESRKTAAAALLRHLQDELAGFGHDVVLTPAPEAECVGSLAHLLQRSQVRLFRERVAGLQEERRDLLLSVSGPWAPYSFMR